MNIDDSSQIRECTSCQMCGAVCPVGAISISLNEQGFYRPYVDENKCIDCSLCVRSCYKFDTEIRDTQGWDGKSMYSAWAKSEEVVHSTTSGGVADLLARSLVEDGYRCIGIAYDTDMNCAVGSVAADVADTQRFRGSKYIQARTVEAFGDLVKHHKREKYAVFGLPCQIYAIDRFLRARGERDRHLLVDLYCHGCPSLNLWRKYVGEILKKTDGVRVLDANFRSKVRGWGNFYVVVVVVVVEGVKYPVRYVSPRMNDPFYTMFFSDTVLNDSCYSCKLRSTLEYTDIRLGDFWGDRFVSNHKGVSGVTLCSEHGREAFEKIKTDLIAELQSFESFLPYQSYGKEYEVKRELRDILLSQLADVNMPLKDSVETYRRSLSLKSQMVLSAKNFVKLMPNRLISALKGITYSLKK